MPFAHVLHLHTAVRVGEVVSRNKDEHEETFDDAWRYVADQLAYIC